MYPFEIGNQVAAVAGGDVWLPFQLDVLTFTDGALTHVSAFLDPAELFALAGLPTELR